MSYIRISVGTITACTCKNNTRLTTNICEACSMPWLSFTHSVAIIAGGCDARVFQGGRAALATDGSPVERPSDASRAGATDGVTSMEGGPSDSDGAADRPSRDRRGPPTPGGTAMAGDATDDAGDLRFPRGQLSGCVGRAVRWRDDDCVRLVLETASASDRKRRFWLHDQQRRRRDERYAPSLSIFYTNGDSIARSIYVGVSGNESQGFLGVFPPTGDWNTVSSISLTMSGLRPGRKTTLLNSSIVDSEAPALPISTGSSL